MEIAGGGVRVSAVTVKRAWAASVVSSVSAREKAFSYRRPHQPCAYEYLCE